MLRFAYWLEVLSLLCAPVAMELAETRETSREGESRAEE